MTITTSFEKEEVESNGSSNQQVKQQVVGQGSNNDVLLPPEPLPNELPYIEIGHPDTMMSKESVRRAVEEFKVRPTDIIVSTFPKTGTTLVTWICHQLRIGGIGFDDETSDEENNNNKNNNFETLYEVVPWPLLSYDIGYDPNVQGNGFYPRVFKSHLRMSSIYRGCRYIVTVRDPKTIAMSFYNFLVLAKKVPSLQDMNISTFVCDTPFIKGKPEDGTRASLWDFYKEYHILRNCSSVLILIYEDLVNDMESCIQMIAKFMKIDPDNNEALIKKVANVSTKEYMSKYVSKFDEPYERAKKLNRAGDVSQLAPGDKIAFDSHKHILDERSINFLNDEWDKVMKPHGYDNYDSFVNMIRTKNKEKFAN